MDVLKEFQAAIEIESSKNIEEFKEQQKLPLDERVAKGVTMANLSVEMLFFDDLPNPWCGPLTGSKEYIYSVKVFCKNNISKFKEGSLVVLSNGTHRFEMEIEDPAIQSISSEPTELDSIISEDE